MRQFYDVTTKIKDTLYADPNVNTVTLGDISEVDLAKQSIFPLAHIIPSNVSLDGRTMSMRFTVICMDVVDVSKEDIRTQNDAFFGQNDLQDIWNTQLAVVNRLVEELRRGDLFDDGYQIEGTISATPFKDRFENLLAGWSIDIDVIVGNVEICV